MRNYSLHPTRNIFVFLINEILEFLNRSYSLSQFALRSFTVQKKRQAKNALRRTFESLAWAGSREAWEGSIGVVSICVLVSYLLVVSFNSQREKRNLLRQTGPSYPADKETLRRLVRLDGSSPPAAKEELIDKAHGAKEKETDAHRCLLPVCALRERTGVNDVQCSVFMRMCNFLQKVRQWMYDITSHSTFDVIIVILILLNTIVLALYHHGIGPEFRHVLDYINLVSIIMT